MTDSRIRTALSRAPEDLRVAIIGAGFGGLCAAIRLKQMGFDNFVLLEQARDVGGTWRDNRYPGAACDVQSHLYSFSFAPWPEWRRVFAEQDQILHYLQDCVRRFRLEPHLRLGTQVTGARFDDQTGRWTLQTGDHGVEEAHVVVTATGGLSQPKWPDIPGVDRFKGLCFHTARWPDDVDLRGKRVAVIGTGASAIQVVPSIAADVAHLDLYQRTPPWVLPKPDRVIGKRERALYARVPALQWLQRQRTYWTLEPRAMGFAIDPRIMRGLGVLARLHLRYAVRDPELRRLVTPDYVIGCKRILMSNDYYEAIQRKNVTLRPGGASALTADGVVDAGGQERPADAVILATGFEAAEAVAPFEVLGRGGISLNELWRGDGPAAFKGTTIHGFPNLFMLVGPNTGLGHSSMVFMIESQVRYTLDAIRHLVERGARALEVRAGAQQAWNDEVQRKLGRTVWASGCNSWYQTSSGRNTTLWPGFTWDFRLRTRRFDPEAYDTTA